LTDPPKITCSCSEEARSTFQNVERTHLSHGSLGTADKEGWEAGTAVAAGGEGWEAGTTVKAVVVAGGEGWEAGAIVVAGGEGWQACLCVGQSAL
jgi:hypothetical protein